MNKRELRLEKYGISGKRYKELCGFCEQYPEWKQSIKEKSILKSAKIDNMPKNKVAYRQSQTEQLAIELVQREKKCAFIESVAQKASEDLWEYIIKAVCYEVPITYLITVENMPLEKSAFYELRRYFFYLLDKEKRQITEF